MEKILYTRTLMFSSIIMILLICYIGSISYYSIKNDFDLFYSSNGKNITTEKTRINDIYNKYHYDYHGKKYDVKYDRLECEKDIEEYVCFKYKFYIHGFLEIFCRPDNITYGTNTIDCNNWLEYYGQDYDYYHYGYNNILITQEHFLKKDNITEEKLNEIFQFNATKNFLVKLFLSINIPKPNYKINFYGGYKGHYKLDCNIFDTLIKQEKIIEYNYEYKTNITVSNINILNYFLFSLFVFDLILLVILFVFKKCIVKSISTSTKTFPFASDSHIIENYQNDNCTLVNIHSSDNNQFESNNIQPVESTNLNIYPFTIYYKI